MKATLKGKVIAESDDIVENDGYFYFPPEECAQTGSKGRRLPIKTAPARMASSSMTW